MILPFSCEIFFYPEPVDFRKQIDGLAILVSDVLSMNPASGQIFLFRNRQADKVKALYFDRNGFWLLYRRLEEGKFSFPKSDEIAMSLSLDQFQWLLAGLDLEDYTPRNTLNLECFK